MQQNEIILTRKMKRQQNLYAIRVWLFPFSIQRVFKSLKFFGIACSKFRIGGQDTTPQSLTANTLDCYRRQIMAQRKKPNTFF